MDQTESYSVWRVSFIEDMPWNIYIIVYGQIILIQFNYCYQGFSVAVEPCDKIL